MADEDLSRGTLLKAGNTYYLIHDEVLEKAKVPDDALQYARDVEEGRSEGRFEFENSPLKIIRRVRTLSRKKLFMCGPDD